jgi:hypothetical protein
MLRSEANLLLPDTRHDHSVQNARPSECSERLWDVLCRNPSVFGRLVSVAEMRNSESGRYESPLCRAYGSDTVDRALREMHREVFSTWLSFRIQQQERDLTVWLASLNPGVAEGLQLIQTTSKRLHMLLPPQHVEPERQLFFQDFQLVSTMVRWADIEAGILFWPGSDEGTKEETPTLVSRVRSWFRSHSSDQSRH